MKNLCLLFIILIMTGCASTEMTGFVDPKYQDNPYKISKIIVKTSGTSLKEAMVAEQKFSDIFNTYNIKSIKYSDIIIPTRKYNTEQEINLLKKSGADSVFTVSIISKGTIEGYVPTKYHPGTTSTIGTTSYTSPGYTTGGYSISEPTLLTLYTLTNIKNGDEIWRAEGESSGDDMLSHLDLLINAGEKAISDMEEKNLIQKSKEKEKTISK